MNNYGALNAPYIQLKADIEHLIVKKTTLKDEMQAGTFTVSDQAKFTTLMSVFDKFDLWFGDATPESKN